MGGELPTFDTIDQANELVGALVMGLWNRLTRHQDRKTPFRLTRLDTRPTRQGLADLALIRRQELDGFIEGLFAGAEAVDFPERVHRRLTDLGEIRALFDGVVALVSDETKPATDAGMKTTMLRMREMTKIAEHEMQAIVIGCSRARNQMLAGSPATKPILH